MDIIVQNISYKLMLNLEHPHKTKNKKLNDPIAWAIYEEGGKKFESIFLRSVWLLYDPNGQEMKYF